MPCHGVPGRRRRRRNCATLEMCCYAAMLKSCQKSAMNELDEVTSIELSQYNGAALPPRQSLPVAITAQQDAAQKPLRS